MANMNITDGYCGEPHVTAQEVRDSNVGIWGSGNYILDVGEKLRHEIITNNKVRIYDGTISMEGLRGGISPGLYLDMTIENGTQNQYRVDLIGVEYVKSTESLTETLNMKVIKGTPSATSYSAVPPTYPSGSIRGGATISFFPLKMVRLSGLNILSVTSSVDKHLLQYLSQRYIVSKQTISGWERIRYSDHTQTVKRVERKYTQFISIWGDAPLSSSGFIPWTITNLGFATIASHRIYATGEGKQVFIGESECTTAEIKCKATAGYTTSNFNGYVTYNLEIEGTWQ